MNDLISRQAAIDALFEWIADADDDRDAIDVICSLSPVTPMRKKGRWIPAFDGKFTGGAYWYNCNQCNHIVPGGLQSGKYFCEYCGADMRGEENQPDNK